MASGMEFMLKSFGLDPEEIQRQVKTIMSAANDFKNSSERIERKLDALLAVNPKALAHFEASEKLRQGALLENPEKDETE